MNKISIISITISVLLVIGALGYVHIAIPRTAYVKLPELYEGFMLKKELASQVDNFHTQTRFILDSLKIEIDRVAIELKATQEKKNIAKINDLQREYALKEKRITEDQQKMIAEFDQQIWNQINQYVQDYSEAHHYDYLIGTSGSGTIMGGNPQLDITEDLLVYVNDRYHGKSK